MKVTKYPQSCLLLEKDGKRIVIDPGRFFTEKYDRQELGRLEAVLYTHQHADHYDEHLAEQFKHEGIPLYGNAAVCELIKADCQVVSGSGFTVAGFKIMPHDLPHFQIEGKEAPQNTGYIIDGSFFHPGDGIKTSDLSVHDLAAPVAGGFTFDDVKKLIKNLGAKRIIPIHYSNQEMYPVDVNEFQAVMSEELEVIVLGDGESVDL